MHNRKRSLWINLSLVNLSIVAFLGFILRSKILFPLNFVDFRSVLSAHSHFAFAGWAGLALMTLLIYDVLPETFSRKKLYLWVLSIVEISALGMAFLFPFLGYTEVTIFFSTLYVVAVVVFVPVFIKDVLNCTQHKTVKLLCVSALLSLMLSFLGTLGLSYIIATRSGGSLLYRDSIYTFLHFQYNGFFTLSIFALALNYLSKKGIRLSGNAYLFALCLSLSIVPALFLSLLWHNHAGFYVLGAVGCVFILFCILFLFRFLREWKSEVLFSGMAKTFWHFALISFILKMLLQVGTIFPQLGNEVYGDRPVIIGFLHLVFLGFLTFFVLTIIISNQYFHYKGKLIRFPFVVFAIGIFANELVLMTQGFSVLININSQIYQWLLWAAAIVLFTGATMITITRLYLIRRGAKNKSHHE